MFTGLITAVGQVHSAGGTAGGLDLTISAPFLDLSEGESIAVDGACLTVQNRVSDGFSAHVIRTSVERTRFADYTAGQRVNLERALRVGDRLGGHIVQGHVDGVDTVERIG